MYMYIIAISSSRKTVCEIGKYNVHHVPSCMLSHNVRCVSLGYYTFHKFIHSYEDSVNVRCQPVHTL